MRPGLRTFAILVVGLAFAPSARADAPGTFSGQWAASALTTAWNIGDWGEACGPKPSGGGERGGTATISQVGTELAFSGVGHPFSTSTCWEQLPGLIRTSHTAGAAAWRTTCKSPPGDPRQSTLVTTVTARSNDQILFDETGQYQFVIKGQNCTASVRRSRYYQRLPGPGTPGTAKPAGTAAPAREPAPVVSAPRPAPVPVPRAASPACALPGPPARIEVRPSHKLIRAGESFEFKAAVVDARGCHLGVEPVFRLEGEAAGVSITPAGKVQVEASAAEGKLEVLASVGARSVSATLDVVSDSRYEALLAQGGFDPNGASSDAAVARLESGSVGARSTVLEDDSGRRRTLFVGIVGAAALALGLVGLVLVRRSRKRSLAVASERVPSSASAPRRPSTLVCPTCREEFGAEAQFCPRDGNRLVPLERGTLVGPTGAVCPVCGQGYDPGVTVCPKHDEPLVPPLVYAARKSVPPAETKKICPVCGAQFGGESQFCGSCGAALVQVN